MKKEAKKVMKANIIISPDGQVSVSLTVRDGVPLYAIYYKGEPFILESALGLELEHASFRSGFTLVAELIEEHRSEWRPLYGERDVYRDHYNELKVTLQQVESPDNKLQISFRVYDEGVAFQYTLLSLEGSERFVITSEHSQFQFPQGCYGYEEHGAEGEYHKVLVKDLKKDCERPLTVEYPNGRYACITEAKLNDYSRMLFTTNQGNRWIVESQLSGIINDYVGYNNMSLVSALPKEEAYEKVIGKAPFETPWRVIIIGEKPGDLLERNYLVLNLNDPCAIEDTSWIIPGSGFRDMTLSTEGSKASIDLAAEYGMKYISLDWGWYGDPFDYATDATTVANPVWFWDPKNSVNHPGLDMEEIIAYGNEKGIGVFLYIDRRVPETQLEKILPVYKKWGIKGVKIGFVNVGPQRWMRWLVQVVRMCAEYGILVNVHDGYRPTGLSRTYPNLLTQEGIRGNEHMPTARHNATLPFTRFPAGAGDYTICYYTDRKQTTHAHQLAMSIIAYSPYQSLFWYDKPADFQGEAEIAFFRDLPVVWDETCVLHGSIGEYATIARRKGDDWYIGAVTNEHGRELQLSLSFLEHGRPYIAYVYADAIGDTELRTKVTVMTHEVRSETKLRMLMGACGGQAMRITPKG
ncbi:glycoside hydrolase family 97 protein [Ectobacillus funiculus]|uniref:glycoside hydrolase family 97 protein n=1 Tax=Ectobacillus funiculus TaxID=137993 RepID=UPI00397B38C9